MPEQHKTHWKRLVNTDYLGVYALPDGEDLVLTIKSVAVEEITGSNGKKENCPVAHFSENAKPMILNRTNMKMITKLYKSPYTEDWAGKRVQVGQDVTRLKGETVECLRIRDLIPRTAVTDKAPVCATCGALVSGAGKMTATQLADYTTRKYGKCLCVECAQAEADAQKAGAAKTDTLQPESVKPDA